MENNMEDKNPLEDTTTLLRFAEQFREMSTDQIAETLVHKPFASLTEEEKVDALKTTNEKLIKINQKVFQKYKQEQEKAATFPAGGGNLLSATARNDPNVPEDTQKAITLGKAVSKIQAFCRGTMLRKQLADKVKEPPKSPEKMMTSGDKELDLMLYLSKITEEKGISMEALYKICEGSESGSVTQEQLTACIKKLKLPLKEGQIKRLIMTVDEECTGNIRYDDYVQALEAYGIRTERYDKSTATTTYGQECAAKLVGILLRRSLEPEELFRMCSKGDLASIPDIVRILSGLNAGLYQRETRAVGRYLDQKAAGTVNKETFLKLLRSADELWRQTARKPLLAWTKGTEARTFASRTGGDGGDIASIVTKMEDSGISAAELVESFGDVPAVSLGKFVNKLTYCYPELSKDERIKLGKAVPLTEGLVDLHELLVFLHEFSQPEKEKPVNVYFQFWTNHIQAAMGTTPAEYFRKEAIGGEIEYSAFGEKVSQAIGLGELVAKMMWKGIATQDEATIQAEDLLEVLESYQNASSQKSAASKTDFTACLFRHNLTLQDVFKLAGSEDDPAAGKALAPSAPAISVLRAFKKLVPELDPQLIRSRLKDHGVADLTTDLVYDTFIKIFDKEGEVGKPSTGDKKDLKESKRDALYWINKIDNAMLELGMSPTAMFQKCDANGDGVITVSELSKVFAREVPEDKIGRAELMQVMKALDANHNGVIDFPEFVNVFKNARAASAIPGQGLGQKPVQRHLPVFGNPIYVRLDEKEQEKAVEKKMTASGPAQAALKKVSESNFSFGELIELMQWDTEGRVTVHRFMKCMDELFGPVLSPAERFAISQDVDKERTGFITVSQLLRFYNENIDLPEDYEKIIRLDLLTLVIAFTKSRKQRVNEFFQGLGVTETQRLSQPNFARFMMRGFGLKEKSVVRLYDHFKKLGQDSPLIAAKLIMSELETFMQQMQVLPPGLDSVAAAKASKVFMDLAHKIKMEKNKGFVAYLNSIGFNDFTSEIHDKPFSDFAVALGVPEDQATATYAWLKSSGQPVLGVRILEELKKASDRNAKQFATQLEQQTIEIVKTWEKQEKVRLVEVFSAATLKDDGQLTKAKLERGIKAAYKLATVSDIKTVLGLLKSNNTADNVTVAEVQEFLRKYTRSKRPSIALEMKLMLVTSRTKYESVLDMFTKSGLDLQEALSKERFMAEIIKWLAIDPKVGEFLFAELAQQGTVTCKLLQKYIEKYEAQVEMKRKKRAAKRTKKPFANLVEEKKQQEDPGKAKREESTPETSPMRAKKRNTISDVAIKIDGVTFSPKMFVSLLESSNKFSLYNFMDQVYFNADDYVSTTGFSSLVKRLYPAAELPQIRLMCRFLDKDKKGMVSFTSIMDAVSDYSTLSTFPEAEPMCAQIATTLNENKLTIKAFLDKLQIAASEQLPVKTFAETIAPKFSIPKKDAYFLYYGLKDPSQSRLMLSDFIFKIERKQSELAEENKSNIPVEPSPEASPDVSKVEEEKDVVVDSLDMNKELALGVIEFYNAVFGEQSKYKMNEKAVFKLFDTDASGYLTRAEFVGGLRKLRLKMNDQHIEEFVKMADKNGNNTISLAEFLETIKLARGRITTTKMQTLAAKHNKDPEVMYKEAVAKVKKFAESKKDDIVTFDYKFQLLDDNNEGVLSKALFEQALKDQNMGLADEEIKYPDLSFLHPLHRMICERADMNKNGVIDYEEFIKYLLSVNVTEIPKSATLKKQAVPKPAAEAIVNPDIASPLMLENIRVLKEETNFFRYSSSAIPIDKIITKIDTPFHRFRLKVPRHFMKKDKTTGKFYATIVNSKRAAFLCAEVLFRRLQPGEKFSDPDFGPTAEDPTGGCSLYPGGIRPASLNSAVCPDPQDVRWLRPAEIAKEYAECNKVDVDPLFMDREGVNANDVEQGRLPDCWFVSAMSALAANGDTMIMSNLDRNLLAGLNMPDAVISKAMQHQLYNSVFSPLFHYYVTKGMYVFRFMVDYEWRYVITDDKLPCDANGVLLYAKGTQKQSTGATVKEFWVSLIEKAYAKLHGNFYYLTGGYIHEALSDLTGLAPLRIELKSINPDKSPSRDLVDSFWNKLLAMAGHFTMGCSATGATEGPIMDNDTRMPTGLMSGHAYAILDAFQIEKKVPREGKDGTKGKSRLIRLRNPWGHDEWTGKWCDDSEEIKKNQEAIEVYYNKATQEEVVSEFKIKLSKHEKWKAIGEEDGTFLMCYKDWRTYFTTMFVCKDFFSEEEPYRGVRYGYEMSKENNGGTPMGKAMKPEDCIAWAKNPHVKLSVKETEVTIHITVTQEDARIKDAAVIKEAMERNADPFENVTDYSYTKTLLSQCFTILRCDGALQTSLDKFEKDKLVFITPLSFQRDIAGTVTLLPGNYMIVPSTKLPGVAGKFWVTVYYPAEAASRIGIEFSLVKAKRTELPRKPIDAYESCEPEFKEFLKKRRPYFLFSQVIDRGEDKDVSLDIKHVRDAESASKIKV